MMSTQDRFAAALRNWALQLIVCVSSLSFIPAITWGQLAAQLEINCSTYSTTRAVLTRHLQSVYHCQPLGLTVEAHLGEACSSGHPERPVLSNNKNT